MPVASLTHKAKTSRFICQNAAISHSYALQILFKQFVFDFQFKVEFKARKLDIIVNNSSENMIFPVTRVLLFPSLT